MFKGKFSILIVVLLAMLFVTSTVFASALNSSWPSAGHDLQNTRNQSTESKINTSNVSSLAPKWTFTTGGDVSATPAVDGSNVYFPDWAGNLYALDQKAGTQIGRTRFPTIQALLATSAAPPQPLSATTSSSAIKAAITVAAHG